MGRGMGMMMSERGMTRVRLILSGDPAALANGNGVSDAGSRRIQELERELGERDRVVGELTIANRILKKTADGSY